MKITLFCFGKLKESFWKDAVSDYTKRISPYAKIEIVELSDEPIVDNPSTAQIEEVKNKEGKKLLAKLEKSAYFVIFDGHGKNLDSPGFAAFLDKAFTLGGSHVSFAIGGSLGLSDEVKARANASLSFGAMTFPHNLARVMALEQIYRCFKILHNEPYHK